MRRLDRKYSMLIGFVGLLIMSAALPARAQYTKAYKFWNTTPTAQFGVRAIVNGLETITYVYTYPVNWKDGFSASYVLFGGTFCTKLTFGGASGRSPGDWAKAYWSTADNSCRLRDLQWATGETITPILTGFGLPGGGYSYRQPDGTLVVVITNDTGLPIPVPNDFSMFADELAREDVNQVLDVGLVGLRSAKRLLRKAGSLGVLPDAGPQQDPAQVGELVYCPWSGLQATLKLPPNGYTTFAVEGVPEGAAYVCQGQIVDDAGNLVLTWVEQAIAGPPVDDTEPPVIVNATIDPPNLWPRENEMVNMTFDVTVTDNSGLAVWYIEGATSSQPEGGDGAPDWVLDPDDVQSLELRAERLGTLGTRTYTVTIRAIDMAGNVSDPYLLKQTR